MKTILKCKPVKLKIICLVNILCINVYGQETEIDTSAVSPPEPALPVYIDVVGAGDLQQSVSSGTDTKASTGAGIIFERCFASLDRIKSKGGTPKLVQTLEIESVINIASTTDSIIAQFNESGEYINRRDFGNFILYPIGKKQSMYFNANLYFGYPTKINWFFKVFSGVNVRILTSNNAWRYENTTIDMGILSLRAGLFHEFIPDDHRLDDKGRSKYSIFLGANYSYRGIIGDIASNDNDVFRQNVLGSQETDFSGFEFNLGFKLMNLRFEVQVPIFKHGKSIPGLTDAQFLYTVRFVGGFPLKVLTN